MAQSELLCDLILHHRLPVVMARESAIALQEQVENEQKQLTGKTPDASQREVVSQLRSVHEQLFRDLGALANQGEDPAAVKQLWRKIQACQTLLPGTPP